MKAQELVNKLIADSYPLLRGKKVHVYTFGFGTLRGLAVRLFPWYRFILVHPKELTDPTPCLTGFFAHELCHLEENERKGYWKSLLGRWKYFTDAEVFEAGERATDKCAIDKGYGRELYQQAKTRRRRIGKYAKYYTSAQEVKKYAIKKGKW